MHIGTVGTSIALCAHVNNGHVKLGVKAALAVCLIGYLAPYKYIQLCVGSCHSSVAANSSTCSKTILENVHLKICYFCNITAVGYYVMDGVFQCFSNLIPFRSIYELANIHNRNIKYYKRAQFIWKRTKRDTS